MAAQLPTHFDRPEVGETFADRVVSVIFDGNVVRMEFAVSRYEQGKSGEPMKEWSYTAARVVLSLRGAVEMLNQMHRLRAALEEKGLLGRVGEDGPASS